MIHQTPQPAFSLGSGQLFDSLATCGLLNDGQATLVVADAFWTDQPVFGQMRAALPGPATIFDQFEGEPKAAHIEAAVQMGRAAGAELVIGMGGGSALDIAKMASLCLAGGHGPMHYALGANPVPRTTCDLIQIPTTAGTGSEANGTAIFAGADGGKLWAYGTALKPAIAILDANLLQSLPNTLKAWCGMDALIHAFEAGTNKWANPVNTALAIRAIELILPALPKAIEGDAKAHEDLLLGSFFAGHAIENTGTAIAHCASHAMARFAPIHHGFATALAFEATLPQVVAVPNQALDRVAAPFGLPPAALPDAITALMDALGIVRVLPDAFKGVRADALAAEMQAEANAPMRNAATFETTPEVLNAIAGTLLAYSPQDHAVA